MKEQAETNRPVSKQVRKQNQAIHRFRQALETFQSCSDQFQRAYLEHQDVAVRLVSAVQECQKLEKSRAGRQTVDDAVQQAIDVIETYSPALNAVQQAEQNLSAANRVMNMATKPVQAAGLVDELELKTVSQVRTVANKNLKDAQQEIRNTARYFKWMVSKQKLDISE